jgi:O-acetyl-ADP-ribose deacetylase (regulator of RNase III)
MTRISVQEGDLTQAEVDAVVNAANTDLVLGAGVAGAIREAGGASIQQECDRHGPVPLGGAALTGAGALPARHVIHAAGMALGSGPSEQSVRDSARHSLELAARHGLRSIAFPAIGTGVGGFPMQRCAEILIEEAQRHAESETSLDEIRFVLFGEPAYRIFEQVLDAGRIRAQLEKLKR